jgi:hypothetical protein
MFKAADLIARSISPLCLELLLTLPQLDDGASVTALMLAIQQQLGVPLEQQRVSRDAALLTAKDAAGIRWDCIPESCHACVGPF